MAVWRCLVILEVNSMIKLAMRRHVLSLFLREHIKDVLVHLGDDFGKEFGLIGRQWLRVQSSCGSGGVADGSQGLDILIIAGWLDINGVDLFTHVDQPFECSRPDQTDRGWCRFAKELVFRVTQGRYSIIIGIGGKNVYGVVGRGTWTGSTGSDGFFDIIRVIDMLDRGVTDRFGAHWHDKGVFIVNFFDEGRTRTFGSDGGIHRLFVTCSLCGFKWSGRGIRRCMTQGRHYRRFHRCDRVGARPKRGRGVYKWHTRFHRARGGNEW